MIFNICRNVISMTLSTAKIISRRFTCLNSQHKHKKLVDPKQTVQIQFAALWVKGLTSFFVLERQVPSVIQKGHFYDADNFLGRF